MEPLRVSEIHSSLPRWTSVIQVIEASHTKTTRAGHPKSCDKYWYNFDSNDWSTMYKYRVGKDFKFKTGYDSDVQLGWTSLWIEEEDGKAKIAPMKMKVQFTLQVPPKMISNPLL